MSRDVLVVRGHPRDVLLTDALERYRGLRSVEPVAAVDERAGPFEAPRGIDKIAVDDAVLAGLGLPRPKDWGWRCGDYFLYAVRRARPSTRFFWLVEPDVFVNFADPDDFFRRFEGHDHDLVGPFLSRRGPGWMWHARMAPLNPEVHGILFPLVRLSGTALDRLLERRRALRETFDDAVLAKDPSDYPNDEAFVATEIVAAGLARADLSIGGKDLYGRETFTVHLPFRLEALRRLGPDGRLYHPAIDDARYERRLPIRFRKLRDPQPALLERHARPNLALLAGPRASALDRWLAVQPLLLGLGHAQLRETVDRLAEAVPAGPVAYALVEGAPPPDARGSAPGDFKLAGEIASDAFPPGAFTPYCADFAARALHFVWCAPGREMLKDSFLYAAQRRHALFSARIPFDALATFLDVADGRMRPVVVMSIGRCGSTLLGRLLRETGLAAVSEPDVFSQAPGLAGTGPGRRGRTDGEVAADASTVLRASLAALAAFAEVPADALALKLRSQANGAAMPILRAFPNARFVFVFREIGPWVRSFSRAFAHGPDQLVHTLRGGIGAYDALVRGGADLATIWYEDLSSDPVDCLEKILRRPLQAAERRRISAAMDRDAQADTAVARGRLERRQAELEARASATLDGFRASWTEARPGRLIEEHALPY